MNYQGVSDLELKPLFDIFTNGRVGVAAAKWQVLARN